MVPGQEEVRIGIAARIRSLPLAGLVLLGVMSSGLSTSFPAFLRFLIAFAAILWIPGVLIHDRALRGTHASAFVRFPLRLLIGVSFVSVVTWLFVVSGAGLGTYAAGVQWLLAAFFVAAWVIDIRAARRSAGNGRDGRPGARWHALLLVALGAFVAAQPMTLSPDRDAYDHIGYIRQIGARGELTPVGVLASVVDDSSKVSRDPRKGTFHDAMALVCRLASIDPVEMWRMLPVVLFPFAFFAFVGFCRVFVPGAWALLACSVLFAMSYGGVGYRYAETVAYGQNLAVIWYWVLVPVLLAPAADSGGWRRAALVGLLGAGGVWVHFGVALHAVVLAATLFVFGRVVNGSLRLAGTLAVVTLAAGAWKYAWLHPGAANLLHAHAQGLLYVSARWFVISPIEVLREHGLLFLGGLAMTPLLAAFVRHHEEARKQLAFAAIPLALCFVPLVTTPLVRVASYMVSRTLLNAAAFPAIVSAFVLTVSWGRRRGWLARLASAAVLVVWGVMFLAPTARAFARSVADDAGERPAATVSEALVDYVRRMPAGSVILSDPRTSYELSALTDQRFVAVHGQHGNPYDAHALDRLEAVRDVLSPYGVSRAALSACDRYGVDFVVVNALQPSSAAEFLSLWDPTAYKDVVEKLSDIAGRFRDVFDGPSFVVFLYDPAGEGTAGWGPPVTPVEFESNARGTACRVSAPGGAFAIESVAVSPDTVLPGETVHVTVGYTKPDPGTFGLPYSMSLRLDNDRVELGRGVSGLKFVRRTVEHTTGERLRYTLVRRPFAGIYDVDMWPVGVTFYESFTMVIPANLALGNYTVRVAVERDTLLPNFALGDLLFNRDRLSGDACGRVEVTGHRMELR